MDIENLEEYNEKLRKECKLLKAMQGISYTQLATSLGISDSSFYNWLSKAYDYGEEKQKHLLEIINRLKD